MKAIENLDDLHNLFFSEWLLPFVELKNTDLILESNFILFNYVKNFGASIPKNNNQDHLEINQNSNKFELINLILFSNCCIFALCFATFKAFIEISIAFA